MLFDLESISIVCVFVFIGGFIDSIAGGGGLISLPAYIFAGLPSHMALGTNKFSSAFGTFFSFIRFMKNGKISYPSAAYSAIGGLIGSFLGAKLAIMLDEKYLRYILVGLIPVIIIFILKKRNFGLDDTSSRHSKVYIIVLSLIIGVGIGTYDGFFGPGTGTFLILAFSYLIGFDCLTSSGNAKLVNLASNISAVITFLFYGKVYFVLGIPAAFAGILGNLIGSKLAIKKGAAIIRPVFVIILVILFVKITYDIINI
jgi:uncharacterized membrane protein YfcA